MSSDASQWFVLKTANRKRYIRFEAVTSFEFSTGYMGDMREVLVFTLSHGETVHYSETDVQGMYAMFLDRFPGMEGVRNER